MKHARWAFGLALGVGMVLTASGLVVWALNAPVGPSSGRVRAADDA
jgi:hypothetical protein